MSWVLKGSTRVAFRQNHSIIDSFLVISDHVPIKCPRLPEMHHVLEGRRFVHMRSDCVFHVQCGRREGGKGVP